MAVVDIYPYRRNTGTGQWERLSSYTLSIVEGRGGGPPVQPKSYPPTSRLASGEWYRVQVTQDGVYALTYEQLQNMGLAGEVPSDQVNLFGRHHGMLPFENDQLPATDLVPNAVVVEDGGPSVPESLGADLLKHRVDPSALGRPSGLSLLVADAAAEHEALFHGVGRPEVFAYGSHYLSGFLNDKPLAALRTDLATLGLARDADRLETEDHVAFVLEVMRWLIAGDDIAVCNLEQQRRFFRTHVQTWVGKLCDAVDAHPRADTWRAVAGVTRAFIEVETQAFDLLEQ